MNSKALSIFLIFCLFLISGCGEPDVSVAPQPQQPSNLAPSGQPNIAARTYPCRNCDVVKLETFLPAQVESDKEFPYRIRITNISDGLVTNVIVTDTIIRNFQNKQSNPPAIVEEGKLKWVFPELGPNQSQEITGTAIATSGGTIQNYVDVDYRMPIRTQIISIKPNVIITKSAPAEISVCAPIIYIFKIENTGTGEAKNLRIYDSLPQGLTTVDRKTSVDMQIGALPAGSSRTITINAKASVPGTYANGAVAIADGEVTAESGTVTTVVRKPILSSAISGPQTGYVNNEITYDITTTNNGDWPAMNTVIENPVPTGFKFVRASNGGSLTDNKVSWKIAQINPGDNVTTSVTYISSILGTIDNTVSASGICADKVSAIAQILVKGAPGILLEVGDTTDPVTIGNTTTYRIVVTNQGTVPVTNIAIKTTLDSKMGLVSSAGATNGQFADGTITFEPLSLLAPKSQAIWEITVRAETTGDVRFKTKMTSNQLDSPVVETESTHFFE